MDNPVTISGTELLSDAPLANSALDLQALEIETFQVESLDDIGVNAGDVTVVLTSSTTSSSCG